GTTPPSNPKVNDLWFDTVSGNLFIYYVDPDSSQWVITQNVSSLPVYLESITASGALTIGGTTSKPTLSITDASTTAVGATRLATNAESTAKTLTTVALTPGVLSSTISSYLTASSDSAAGIVELATTAETSTGTDTTKAVTPKALKDSLASLGASTNPVGTVISFASQTVPAGYLKCDGSLVNRTTYAALFAVIGTVYSAGDTATTFGLPTLSHSNINVIYCIKT
ncbi:MAG: tail fiber protein, partial [Cyanophyceae cyanobacterium]